MTPSPAVKPHDSYRHEAFFYRGLRDFLAGTVPFVRDGVAAGQPVMVAVPGTRLELVRGALGTDAERVTFVDMAELGRNPARIIPAWRDFVEQARESGSPVRGIGEPVWSGRSDVELAECQLHEALLNMAVEPDTPLWLRCPYDGDGLDPALLADAHRTHPVLVEVDDFRGSTRYGGADHVLSLFGEDLPEPDGLTAGPRLRSAGPVRRTPVRRDRGCPRGPGARPHGRPRARRARAGGQQHRARRRAREPAGLARRRGPDLRDP